MNFSPTLSFSLTLFFFFKVEPLSGRNFQRNMVVMCHSIRSLLTLSLLAVFLFSSSISLALGDFQTLLLPISGGESEAKYGVEFTWGSRRSVVEGGADEAQAPVAEDSNSMLVLAAKRTYRRDPLNGFKKYNGGWNISERHYWASVGSTAVPLFAIAVIWFLGFGLCLLVFSLCYYCSKRQSYGHSRTAYSLSLIFLIILTICAIIGCVVLYTGQGRFHSSTTKTLKYVVYQADTTTDKLRNVSDYLATAKLIGIDQVFLPSNVQTDIDEIGAKINSSTSTLAGQTMENSDDAQDLFDSVRLALIVITAMMLLLTFLGLLFSMFGMQFLVYILIVIGWLLVTGTFILCGTFLLLHNVVGDTCVAMDQWVQNPSSHTALDEILPCVDKATTLETLSRSKEVTSQLVDLVNQVITNVSNINFSPNFVPLYFNQSGPLLPLLCNPFSPVLTDRACTAGEVDLRNATQVWSNYVCQISASGICTTTGRLTPTFYDQMSTAVNVSLALYDYAPFLVELQDCTFARQAFADMYRDHCPGIRKYSKWIYVGLVMVSTAVMLSLVLWVIYGRERRHRLYGEDFVSASAQSLDGHKDS